MSTTLEVNDAFEVQNVLDQLARDRLPGKVKKIIYQQKQKLEDPLKPFEETRNDLVEEYGEDGQVSPMRGDFVGFQAEWQDVIEDEEIEIDSGVEKIPFHYFENREVEADITVLLEHGFMEFND